MKRDEARSIARKVAWHYLGTLYKWGGDDPTGFDCSGLVIEILKSVGILPRGGDWTAHSLWLMFEDHRMSAPRGDYLVFWWNGDKSKIIHVEYCVNGELALGASGGGSRTKTDADAAKQNAYIKIRPIKSRGNVAGYVDPFRGLKE